MVDCPCKSNLVPVMLPIGFVQGEARRVTDESRVVLMSRSANELVRDACKKALRPKPPNQAQIQWLLDGSNGRADPDDFDCGDCGEVHDWIKWALGELGDGE